MSKSETVNRRGVRLTYWNQDAPLPTPDYSVNCARCGIRPRHRGRTRRPAYCRECENTRKRRDYWRNPQTRKSSIERNRARRAA